MSTTTTIPKTLTTPTTTPATPTPVLTPPNVSLIAETDVKRIFLPRHGRISRRIAKRAEHGWSFTGCVPSGILGLFLCHLAYERRT